MPEPENKWINEIDAEVSRRSLLLHPFYQSWTRGEMDRDSLRDYAKQYYHHVAAFPTYLSALHSHTSDPAARRHLLANLMDEESGCPNHPELWLQFADGLGVTEEEVQATELWPETRELIGTFRAVCRDRSTADGLAALYAYESQIPAVAESKIDGLRRFYGLTSPKALSYFEVHIEADRTHAEVERKLLGMYVNETHAPAVMRSVREVLDALWEMLSGVCRRHATASMTIRR